MINSQLPSIISVLDSSFDPVGVFDTNYRYTYMNQKLIDGVYDAYGVNIKPGMSLEEMLRTNPEDYAESKTYWDRTLAGETFSVTHEYGFENKRSVYKISFGPIRDEKGIICGGLHWSKNVSAEIQQREEDFQATFDLAAIGLAHTNLRGEWIRVNKALCEITGYFPKELLEKNFLGITHPDDVPLSNETIQNLIEKKIQIFSTEKRYLHKKGHQVWVHVTVTLKRNQNDEPEYFIVSINDIDNIKKIELAISESEEKFRHLANTVPQIIWTMTGDGKHEYYNDRWYEFTGDIPGSLAEETWHRLVHPDEIEASLAKYETARREGTVFVNEFRMLDRSTNTYRWFLARAIPVKDNKGNVIQWVGTSTDIHERKISAENLANSLRMRDEFLSIASHEFKTPVTTLSMSAQMLGLFHGKKLAELQDGGKIIGSIDQIEHQIRRLNHIINEMLDITRIRSGKLSLFREEFDIGELVYELVLKLTPQILLNSNGVPPRMNIEKIIGSWDKARIEQIVTSLIFNAMIFSNGKLIEISVTRIKDLAQIKIVDHGLGTNLKDINIFDQFENPTGTQITGLDLYIAKEIVEAHGGNVKFKSEAGKGSEFIVELPVL